MPVDQVMNWIKFFAHEPPVHEAVLVAAHRLIVNVGALAGNKKKLSFLNLFPFWRDEQSGAKLHKHQKQESFRGAVALIRMFKKPDKKGGSQ